MVRKVTTIFHSPIPVPVPVPVHVPVLLPHQMFAYISNPPCRNVQTGPMTMGLRPPPIHAFLASQKRSSTESLEAPPVYVAGGESAGTVAAGRMRGPMGRLCVKLHSWCLEVRYNYFTGIAMILLSRCR